MSKFDIMIALCFSIIIFRLNMECFVKNDSKNQSIQAFYNEKKNRIKLVSNLTQNKAFLQMVLCYNEENNVFLLFPTLNMFFFFFVKLILFSL